MAKKKQEVDITKIKSFWGMLAYLVQFHWWKLLILLFAVGVFIGGWHIKTEWFDFNKEPVKVKAEAIHEENN